MQKVSGFQGPHSVGAWSFLQLISLNPSNQTVKEVLPVFAKSGRGTEKTLARGHAPLQSRAGFKLLFLQCGLCSGWTEAPVGWRIGKAENSNF